MHAIFNVFPETCNLKLSGKEHILHTSYNLIGSILTFESYLCLFMKEKNNFRSMILAPLAEGLKYGFDECFLTCLLYFKLYLDFMQKQNIEDIKYKTYLLSQSENEELDEIRKSIHEIYTENFKETLNEWEVWTKQIFLKYNNQKWAKSEIATIDNDSKILNLENCEQSFQSNEIKERDRAKLKEALQNFLQYQEEIPSL